jgi:hypothetical protein
MRNEKEESPTRISSWDGNVMEPHKKAYLNPYSHYFSDLKSSDSQTAGRGFPMGGRYIFGKIRVA